jgi:hypothetical protein
LTGELIDVTLPSTLQQAHHIYTHTHINSAHTTWDDEDDEDEDDDDTTITDNSALLSEHLSSDPQIRAKQLVVLGGASMTGEAVQRLAALKVGGCVLAWEGVKRVCGWGVGGWVGR